MQVLGLTGSIAMGKSTVAGMFRALGVPVFDADAEVHALLARGGAAVDTVRSEFPEAFKGGAIDRKALGAMVFGDAGGLKRLEAILHPMVGEARRRFLGLARRRQDRLVVLDVPLLFETGGERYCDAVAVVSAPRFVQRRRFRGRRGMTAARIGAILKRQMPDAKKRCHAEHVIDTGVSLWETRRQVRQLAKRARG